MRPSCIIVGLGNPGAAYERTRHNVGFRAIDAFAQLHGAGAWMEKQKFVASVQEARCHNRDVLLVKPKTYMNDSGACVEKLVHFYKIDPAKQLLVLCDDLDIPAGTIRLRDSGGPGTHNGLRSIVMHLGEGFARLRIGIGGSAPRGEALAGWVLSIPPKEEQDLLDTAIEEALKVIPEFIAK